MNNILALICIFLYFFAVPFAVSTVARRITQHHLLLSFSLAPPFYGLATYCLFRVFPGKSPDFYQVALMVPSLVFVGLVIVKRSKELFKASEETRNLFLFLFLFLLFFFMLYGLPLYEKDALEYSNLANIFFRDRSFSIYPFAAADPQTGYYTPIRHPLGFTTVLVFQLLQGIDVSIGIKLVNAYYMVLLLVLVREFVGKSGVLCVLSTPLFLYVFSTCQIDIYRIQLFTLTICMFSVHLKGRENLIITSLCLIAAFLSHSLSLLLLPVLAIGLIYIPVKEWWKHILFFSLSFFIAGEMYIRNYAEFGKFVTDSNIIWSIKAINENADLLFRRHIDTTFSWLFFGLFQGFTKVHFFGLHFYLAAYALFRRGISFRDHLAALSLITSVLFFLLVCFSGPLGAKNPRYFLTIVPLLYFIYGPYVFSSLKHIHAVFMLFIALSVQYFTNWSLCPKDQGLFRSASSPFFKKLKALPIQGPILSFEQEQIVFNSNERIISDLDPKMVALYNKRTTKEALDYMRENKILHIFVPPFMPATFYNSQIASIAGNPAYAELLIDENGYRLFKIREKEESSTHSSSEKTAFALGEVSYLQELLYQRNKLYILDKIKNEPEEGAVQIAFHLEGDGFAEIYVNNVCYGRVSINKSRIFSLQLDNQATSGQVSVITYKDTLLTNFESKKVPHALQAH